MKLFSMVLLALLSLAAPAQAQEAAKPTDGKFPAAIVAVVDIQKILQEASAAKGVREQLATRRNTYQKQITADEQKLRTAEQELTTQRGKITPEEFAKKRKAFEENVRSVQKNVQERAQILDKAFNDALATIRNNLGEIVAAEASKRGVTLVLDKGQVVVVESTLDLTTEVLKGLNAKLPKVAVKLP